MVPCQSTIQEQSISHDSGQTLKRWLAKKDRPRCEQHGRMFQDDKCGMCKLLWNESDWVCVSFVDGVFKLLEDPVPPLVHRVFLLKQLNFADGLQPLHKQRIHQKHLGATA